MTLAERENRQLQRLLKEKARPKSHVYLWYMVLILALIYIVDEIATNLPNALETEINIFVNLWSGFKSHGFEAVNTFARNGYSVEELNGMADGIEKSIGIATNNGLSNIGTVKLLANATLVLSMFYRALADKYGRKIFLFINTLGMAASLFVIYLSTSFIGFAVGFFALRFFVTPDQQVIYLDEIAPQNKRGAMLSITKGVAELALVFISILRKIFYVEGTPEWYRNIFLAVAIAAAVVSFIALIFARESDIFLDERIAYLKKTEEEKLRLKEEHDASKSQGGFIQAIKYSIKDKQILWIMIATAIIELGYSSCNNYETVLTYGFLGAGKLDEDAITNVLTWFPFSCAAITLVHGFISDKIGRKKTAIMLLSVATLSFVLELVGIYLGWNQVIIGLLLGLLLGADWAIGDVLALMASESCTTNMRSSIMSSWSMFFGFGMLGSMGITMILPNVIGTSNISLGYILLAVPAWIIGLIILISKTKETAGVDLATIGQDK